VVGALDSRPIFGISIEHTQKEPYVAGPKNSGKSWSGQDEAELKRLASGNTPTRVIGLKLGRSEDAVRGKAQELNVSLKPTNQSPYNRRKK
jgi:hypothetical protein